MLEIIALCSCACLAGLWCALAFEVTRDRYCGGWIFRRPDCGWRCSSRKCACCKCIGWQARDSLCKNSYSCSHPSCTAPSYKLVCKVCRRVKSECICTKFTCHRTSDSTRCRHADASCVHNFSLPNLACREMARPIAPCRRCTTFSQNTKESRETQSNKMGHNRRPRRSRLRQILERKRKRRKSKDAKR